MSNHDRMDSFGPFKTFGTGQWEASDRSQELREIAAPRYAQIQIELPAEFQIKDSTQQEQVEKEKSMTIEGFYTGSIQNIQKKRRKSIDTNRSSSETRQWQNEEPAHIRLSSPKPNPEAEKIRSLRSIEKTPRGFQIPITTALTDAKLPIVPSIDCQTPGTKTRKKLPQTSNILRRKKTNYEMKNKRNLLKLGSRKKNQDSVDTGSRTLVTSPIGSVDLRQSLTPDISILPLFQTPTSPFARANKFLTNFRLPDGSVVLVTQRLLILLNHFVGEFAQITILKDMFIQDSKQTTKSASRLHRLTSFDCFSGYYDFLFFVEEDVLIELISTKDELPPKWDLLILAFKRTPDFFNDHAIVDKNQHTIHNIKFFDDLKQDTAPLKEFLAKEEVGAQMLCTDSGKSLEVDCGHESPAHTQYCLFSDIDASSRLQQHNYQKFVPGKQFPIKPITPSRPQSTKMADFSSAARLGLAPHRKTIRTPKSPSNAGFTFFPGAGTQSEKMLSAPPVKTHLIKLQRSQLNVPGYTPTYNNALAKKVNQALLAYIGSLDSFQVQQSVSKQEAISMMNDYISLIMKSSPNAADIDKGVLFYDICERFSVSPSTLSALCPNTDYIDGIDYVSWDDFISFYTLHVLQRGSWDQISDFLWGFFGLPTFQPLENALESKFVKLQNYNHTLDSIWRKISDKLFASPHTDVRNILKTFSILELRYLAGQIIKNCQSKSFVLIKMEACLRVQQFKTEYKYRDRLRSMLQQCSSCVVKQCENLQNFENCKDSCLAPCIKFRADLEALEQDFLNRVKSRVSANCQASTDFQVCRQNEIHREIDEYLEKALHKFLSQGTKCDLYL